MRKIKLVADTPFHNNCDFAVVDVTEQQEKKRCKIKVEYAKSDVALLIREGHTFETTLSYYHDWIYNTVKRYIGDDWECTEGLDQIIDIVAERIKSYF